MATRDVSILTFFLPLLLPSVFAGPHRNNDNGTLTNHSVRLCFVEVLKEDLLLQTFSDRCKLKYTWILPPKDRKISLLDWLIDTVQKQEADMIPSPVFMNEDRSKKFDFLQPFAFFPVSFAAPSPKRVHQWTAISKPFKSVVWISIAFVTVAISIFLYIILRIKTSILGCQSPSILVTFWHISCTLINQGVVQKLIRGMASQLIIGVWLLAATVIASAYACTLVSSLLNPEYSHVPQTFEQLSNEVLNGRYTVGSRRSSAVLTLLSNSKERTDKIISDAIKSSPDNTADGDWVGMRRVLTTNHAYIFIQSNLRLIGSQLGDSNFFYSDDVMFTFAASYVVRKGFPRRRCLNKIILRLFESGVLQKEERLTEYKLAWKNENKQTGFHSLGLIDMQGPFILLSFGYIASSVTLCLEVFFKTVQHRLRW